MLHIQQYPFGGACADKNTEYVLSDNYQYPNNSTNSDRWMSGIGISNRWRYNVSSTAILFIPSVAEASGLSESAQNKLGKVQRTQDFRLPFALLLSVDIKFEIMCKKNIENTSI